VKDELLSVISSFVNSIKSASDVNAQAALLERWQFFELESVASERAVRKP